MNLKCIIDVNIKLNMLKFLEGNAEEHCYLGLGKKISNKIGISWIIKEKY